MADPRTVRISKQLQSQAESLLTKAGVELAHEALETSAALLWLAKEAVNPGQVEPIDRDMMTDEYQQVADYVSEFIKRAGLDLVENDSFAQGTGDRLKKLKEMSAKLAQEAQEKNEEIEKVSREILDFGKTIENKSKEKEEMERNCDELKEVLKQFSPETFIRLKEEQQKLYKELTETKAQFDQEDQKRKDLEKELLEIREQIDALPETLKNLLSQMDKLNVELDRIREANETCNSEKQAEARDEIDKREKQLEEDKVVYEELTKRVQELRTCTVQYDSDTQTLETEAIDLINKTIRAMRPKLEEHQKKLERIRDENAQLENSYRECNDLREQFDAWFTGDATPLEKLINVMKEDGNIMLKGTLDLRNCESIQRAIARIRNDLKYLDDTLKKAAQAYGMDVQEIQRRALGKTPQ